MVVERHQLTAGVPEELRHEVRGVHSRPLRVYTTQLGFIVSGQEIGLRHEILQHKKKKNKRNLQPKFKGGFFPLNVFSEIK